MSNTDHKWHDEMEKIATALPEFPLEKPNVRRVMIRIDDTNGRSASTILAGCPDAQMDAFLIAVDLMLEQLLELCPDAP
jgi:hypothetical protein